MTNWGASRVPKLTPQGVPACSSKPQVFQHWRGAHPLGGPARPVLAMTFNQRVPGSSPGWLTYFQPSQRVPRVPPGVPIRTTRP